MKMSDIKTKAQSLGIKPGKLSKTSLIQTIQEAEGNNACYGENDGTCLQVSCCWFDDCAGEYKKNSK